MTATAHFLHHTIFWVEQTEHKLTTYLIPYPPSTIYLIPYPPITTAFKYDKDQFGTNV